MFYYTTEKMNAFVDDMMKTEEPTDICRFWRFADEGIAVLNKDEVKEQFTHYKNLGTMKIEDYNNKMIKRNGRKFYVLVVQHTDEDKNPNCYMSLLAYGLMVSGFPYWFDKKKDRDMAVKIFRGD